MFFLRSIILTLFITLVSGSRLRLKREAPPPHGLVLRTNAARMAAGLGPLRPRSLMRPSAVQAKRAQPSGTSCTNYNNKYVKVYRSSNDVLVGYIKSTYVGSNQLAGYGITTSQSYGMQVSFSVCASSSQLELAVGGAYPYLGFAGSSTTHADIQSGSSNANQLIQTKHTAAGVGPSSVGNSDSNYYPLSESSIWNFDTTNNHLSVQWVNTDLSNPATLLFWDPAGNGLLQITGDASKFTTANPSSYQVYYVVSS